MAAAGAPSDTLAPRASSHLAHARPHHAHVKTTAPTDQSTAVTDDETTAVARRRDFDDVENAFGRETKRRALETRARETARVSDDPTTRENMPAAEDDDATEALDEDDDDDDARPSGVRRASNRSEIYISPRMYT